jgi:16S rRNA (cytidine1402-2'-O)-methyltransferase
VREAHRTGIRVSPIPGPSAVAAALSASGFEGTQFLFLGFPPRSGRARSEWLARLKAEPGIVVIFEAPHRIAVLLQDLECVNRPIIALREISKINEELVVSPSHDRFGAHPLGEFAVVVGASDFTEDTYRLSAETSQQSVTIVDCLTKSGDFDADMAIDIAAAWSKADPSAIRKAVKKARIARKQRDAGVS